MKAWHNVSIGTDLLKQEYQTTLIPEQSHLHVKFAGPEMIKSDQDKVDMWSARIEQGEATVIDMIMDLRGVDRDAAMELLKENQEINDLAMGVSDGGSISDDASDQSGRA